MIETLYKTDRPEKGKSECYVLVLTTRPASHGRSYSFMEEHGRWDESLGRFRYEVTSIIAEEALTHEDALKKYTAAREGLFKRGFVHSFSLDRLRKKATPHRFIGFETATA
jgi:hypothetical protein